VAGVIVIIVLKIVKPNKSSITAAASNLIPNTTTLTGVGATAAAQQLVHPGSLPASLQGWGRGGRMCEAVGFAGMAASSRRAAL
jgi:hypothetical protein